MEPPVYRSILVDKSITEDWRQDMLTATPSLEATNILMSMAMTEGVGFKRGQEKRGMKLDFIDVRRAYFYAPSKRTVYVQLPAEDQ